MLSARPLFRSSPFRSSPPLAALLFTCGLAMAASLSAAGESSPIRTIAVHESSLQIQLWDEQAADGSNQAYYQILREGEAVGRARQTNNQVQLQSFRFDPLTDGSPSPSGTLTARPDNRLFLVQLFATALPEFQTGITSRGAKIHRYYTEHTVLVEMSAAERATIASLPYVRWVGSYHPAFRVETFLREVLAAGEGTSLGNARYSIMLNERGPAAQDALSRKIQALGGDVEILTAESFRMEASLSPAALVELAHDNRVHYIDRWGGPGETDMDIVREVGGGDYVETETGFTGQGVRGEIFDTEMRITHQEWALAPIVHNPSGTTTGGAHGTGSASNVFAQGTNPLARGMIPSGQSMFFHLNDSTQFGGGVSRHTIAEELNDPAGLYRAVFQTSSVGNSRTFFYTTISAEMDDALFLHQVLHTQSQSNAGNQDSRPQAWSKNIVSVGGFRHQGTADRSDDSWSFTGSIGPADDGRIKPDLAFFYDGIFSANDSSDTSYGSFGGTSSATPQTAGHFGLLYQMWHEGLWAGHGGGADVFDSRPNMITAKALMIHHAFRYDWNSGGSNADIDRFKQGWGTADVRNLYDDADTTLVIDESEVIAPGGTYLMTVELDGSEAELKATMAYLDTMGTPGAAVHRVNDLSLKVTSPSAVTYWGNNGLADDNFSTPDGVSNTIDTVENVFIPNPEAGTWTIEVLGDEIVADTHTETPEIDADFALIVSPASTGSSIFGDDFESGTFGAWIFSSP